MTATRQPQFLGRRPRTSAPGEGPVLAAVAPAVSDAPNELAALSRIPAVEKAVLTLLTD
ncbi:MAG: hypothetical protein WKF57_09405 [Nakamurella sp.]